MSSFELMLFQTDDDLAVAVARAWLDEIETAKRDGQIHCVALSGGKIARKFFAATFEAARSRSATLEHVHFFWADERCVPPTAVDSNFRLAQELLFAPLNLPKHQIHRIRGEDDPRLAARQAAAELRRIAPSDAAGQPALDLVLLGLGEDGHIASLFPGEPNELIASEAIYRPVFNSPKPPPQRVTIGYRALAAARQVWTLATGADKQTALTQALSPDGQTPFSRLLRIRPKIKIFTDIVVE